MLDLKAPNFNFTNNEILRISKIMRSINQPNFNADKKWRSHKALYKKIRKAIDINQNGRCAYCEMILNNTSPIEVDHFVDKATYPKWMYHKENLVGACHYCNSSLKGDKPTVEQPKNKINNYSDFEFIIVHPYLDKVSDYFEYERNNDQDHYLFVKPNSNLKHYNEIQKAYATIKMFDLNLAVRVNARIIAENAIMYHCMKPRLEVLKSIDIDSMNNQETKDLLKSLQEMARIYVK